MTVSIKTPDDIAKMRIAGRLAAQVLEMIEEHVKVGVTTDELNTICHDHIVNVQKAIPAPLNYNGFPKSICTSINMWCATPPSSSMAVPATSSRPSSAVTTPSRLACATAAR